MQTVKELIEELQKYPPDFKVMGVAKHDNGGFWCPVEIQPALGITDINSINHFEFEMPLVHIVLNKSGGENK